VPHQLEWWNWQTRGT